MITAFDALVLTSALETSETYSTKRTMKPFVVEVAQANKNDPTGKPIHTHAKNE